MIKANFNTYDSYVTDSLYQWDLNQVLSVSGLNLTVAPEVHFSNAILGKSLVRQAELDKGVVNVNIPNSLLQNDLDILAYVGLYEGSTFKVIETVRIPVIKKEKPGDYKIENDEEIYSFNELENKIVNAKKDMEKYADDKNANLKARVDNIISHNNDTEGNTELIDIRTDSNGIIHKSAGSAVRDSISAITDNLKNIYVYNHFDKLKIKVNKYCEYGLIKDYTGWNCSDLIAIPKGRKLSLVTFLDGVKSEDSNLYVDCYDNNKSHITDSTFRNVKLSDVVFPSNASYFYVSGRSNFVNENTVICEYSDVDKVVEYFDRVYPIINTSLTKIETDIENIKNAYSVDSLRSIARIGYDVYNVNTPPQQSIESFKLAYEKGFRILLCDLRFTSDDEPVLSHDDTVSYALNRDGSSPTIFPNISTMTYSQLSNYDYGLYKGNKYANTNIMRLEDMCKLCRKLGCELYIELKVTSTEDQIKKACRIVEKFQMTSKTSWVGSVDNLGWIVNTLSGTRVALITGDTSISDNAINRLKEFEINGNKVFLFGWDTVILTDDIISKLITNKIPYEMGTLNTEKDIKNYFNKGDNYYYCTGIESNLIVASNVFKQI